MMGTDSLVLDRPSHEMPDLLQPRENGLDAAFDSASQQQQHDMSSVACTGNLHEGPSVGDASRAFSVERSFSVPDPAILGPESQIKDENGQLGGNMACERTTAAQGEYSTMEASGSCPRVWNGDLFLQVRDILLHALASARTELETQLKASGVNLDAHGQALLLKRAQFLLYTCRHAKQPSQEQLTNLRLVELLNTVRKTDELADLHRPCTLLLGIGEWMKRAEAVGMKPESFPSDVSPATVSPIVTNGILHAEHNEFVGMATRRASLLNTLSPGESAESPMKHAHENANGFSAQDVTAA